MNLNFLDVLPENGKLIIAGDPRELMRFHFEIEIIRFLAARKICPEHREEFTRGYVREPTRTNKVHYHLLLRSTHSMKELVKIIEESLPSRKLGRWHKNIKPIEGSDWRLLHYITKARTKGKTKAGKFVPDLYSKKRLLFKPKLGIRKVGSIGEFWFKGKDDMWQDVIDKEKKIAEGLTQPNVKRLARHAYDFIEGYVPLEQIERSFGHDWDSDTIQNWIEQVLDRKPFIDQTPTNKGV